MSGPDDRNNTTPDYGKRLSPENQERLARFKQSFDEMLADGETFESTDHDDGVGAPPSSSNETVLLQRFKEAIQTMDDKSLIELLSKISGTTIYDYSAEALHDEVKSYASAQRDAINTVFIELDIFLQRHTGDFNIPNDKAKQLSMLREAAKTMEDPIELLEFLESIARMGIKSTPEAEEAKYDGTFDYDTARENIKYAVFSALESYLTR